MVVLGCLAEPIVERRDGGLGFQGRQQDATVRHLEAGADPQLGQANGSGGRERQFDQLEIAKCCLRRRQQTISDWRDQHLRQCQGVGPNVVVDCSGQQRLGGHMMVVITIQIGNENAGIKDDHAGHSGGADPDGPVRRRR